LIDVIVHIFCFVLFCFVGLQAFGAAQTVITDVNKFRLDFVAAYGSAFVNVDKLTSTDASLRIIQGFAGSTAVSKPVSPTSEFRPHITIDCCGFESSMQTALEVTQSGGKVCIVGMGHNQMQLPMTAAACREVDIIGVFRFTLHFRNIAQKISQ
jgi:L-iditol 2-dehydrogenase